jgi:hypothetical protein
MIEGVANEPPLHFVSKCMNEGMAFETPKSEETSLFVFYLVTFSPCTLEKVTK